MAKSILDIHASVLAKANYVSVLNAADVSIKVTKNGLPVVNRVIYNVHNDTVTIGDGSGVGTGDATAWLNSLK